MDKPKILLINAPPPMPISAHNSKALGMPPLGLGYIATYINQYGYHSKIIDLLSPSKTIVDVFHFLQSNTVKIVGISCSTETFNNAIRIAKEIKDVYANCFIVLGGAHVSFEYESALKETCIDYVVINEGELVFKNLCDYLICNIGDINNVKGIAYKQDNRIVRTEPEAYIHDLDSLPIPDRSLFDNLSSYPTPATIVTSRGCPGQCIFCAASVLSGGKYRMRSAKNVVAEFEYLKGLGFNHVVIVDDTMTVNKNRLKEFTNTLISKKLGMTWYCESRVDSINKEILKSMQEAGLTSIQFGIESGSHKVVENIQKGVTIEQAMQAFNWCKELGINASTCLMIGQPDDDVSTIKETLDLAKSLINMKIMVALSICTPFPGTALWKAPDKYGITIVEFDLDFYDLYTPVFNTKHLSSTEIRNAFYDVTKEIINMERIK